MQTQPNRITPLSPVRLGAIRQRLRQIALGGAADSSRTIESRLLDLLNLTLNVLAADAGGIHVLHEPSGRPVLRIARGLDARAQQAVVCELQSQIQQAGSGGADRLASARPTAAGLYSTLLRDDNRQVIGAISAHGLVKKNLSRLQLEASALIAAEGARLISLERKAALEAVSGNGRLDRLPCAQPSNITASSSPGQLRVPSEQLDPASATALLEELLFAGRINSSAGEPSRRGLVLQTLMELAIERVQPLLASAHHELRVDYDQQPILLHGAARALEEAFTEVLLNAIVYTPRGGRLIISTRRVDRFVEVAVSDNGSGIPERELEHIFSMYRQPGRGRERAAGRTGLGLAMVKVTVERLGGSVYVHSNGIGRGSTVTLRFPADSDMRSKENCRRESSSGAQRDPRRSVLVIDDSTEAADIAIASLRRTSHLLHIVRDPGQLFQAVREFQPDIIMLDMSQHGSLSQQIVRRTQYLDPKPVILPLLAQPPAPRELQPADFLGHCRRSLHEQFARYLHTELQRAERSLDSAELSADPGPRERALKEVERVCSTVEYFQPRLTGSVACKDEIAARLTALRGRLGSLRNPD